MITHVFRSLCVLPWLLTASFAVAQDTAQRQALLHELEGLMYGGQSSVDGAAIASLELLDEFYGRRDYELVWTDRDKIVEWIEEIKASPADGFNVHDYHLTEIEEAYRELEAGRLSTPNELAGLDLMLTDSLIRLAYHQRFGKVNPYDLDVDWNFRRGINKYTPVEAVEAIINGSSPGEHMHSIIPRGPRYLRLQSALADYRKIAADDGWPEVADGDTIRSGSTDRRLAAIEQRLAVTGDLAARQSDAGERGYDMYLQDGVRRFQARHGLDADGVIGPATIAAMNVTVAERILQLEVNLERVRWLFDDIDDNVIVVNIAGFEAYLLRDSQVIWSTKVQVGRPYHQTPVFRDNITYLAINPTWTVPYSIATKEMLPKLKADASYLAERNFDVKDREGNVVDSTAVDWASLSTGRFPYTLVQRPGPSNALGRIKFMFPNKFAVYLHDTPSKYLFERAGRAFSHGCIRVENPFSLAELLLAPQGWDMQRIQDTLDSEKLTNVVLDTPLPVLLVYFSARVGPDDIVLFFEDVYERDARVAAALDEPFKLELPDGAVQ